jgi:hypothetical protein
MWRIMHNKKDETYGGWGNLMGPAMTVCSPWRKQEVLLHADVC